VTGPVKAPRRKRAAAAVVAWPWAVLAQLAGVALVVAGVALVFAVAWAVLAGGVLLLAGGTMAESAQVRSAAAAWKRQQDARARRAA
jgi:hypothetical protein